MSCLWVEFCMRLLAAVVLLVLLGTHCKARLGDTPTECGVRYGRPISHGSAKDKGNETGLDWYAYAMDGFEHEIHFFKGRAVLEVIWKLQQPDIPSARPPLSEEEKQRFLDENAGGLSWSIPLIANKDYPGYEGWTWNRTDKATAEYSLIDREMHFCTFHSR